MSGVCCCLLFVVRCLLFVDGLVIDWLLCVVYCFMCMCLFLVLLLSFVVGCVLLVGL